MNCENCGDSVTRAKLVQRQWLCPDCAAFTVECTKIYNVASPQHKSEWALGIHPSQVPAARKHWKKIHTGIDWQDNGDVKFSSRGARKAMLKAAGMVDRDGGYGD
jgi:hypothetical protein